MVHFANIVFVSMLSLLRTIASSPVVQTPRMPEACRGKTYCNSSENYPQQIVDAIVTSLLGLNPADSRHDVWSERDGFADWDQTDCQKERTNEFIYYIVDSEDNVRYVVQAARLKTQYQVEQCKNPGKIVSETTHFTQAQVNHPEVDIFCVQRNSPRGFLVLKKDMRGFEVVNIKNGLPTSCTIESRHKD